MADEAVVRIILDAEGGGTTGAPVAPAASVAHTTSTSVATDDIARRRAEREEARNNSLAEFERNKVEFAAMTDLQPAEVPVGGGSDEDIAKRRKEREAARNKSIGEFDRNKEEFQQQTDLRPAPPSPPPSVIPVPPPAQPQATVGDSKKKLLEEKISQIESWLPEPGSPAAKRLEKLKKRLEEETAAEAEYGKIKPPPPPSTQPFDPVALAKKRVKAEEERAAVDAEYAKLKPKGKLDALLELAESFRGAIGGVFGTVVGATLDVTAKFRDLKSKAGTGAPDLTSVAPPVVPLTTPPANLPPSNPPASTPEPTVPSKTSLSTTLPETPTIATNAPNTDSAVAKLGGAAEASGSKLASMVPVVGAAVASVGVLVGAFNAVSSVINRMADRYGDLNPVIAQQQAMAEIRMTLGDIRRARESGNELAGFIKVQSEMQQRWEDIKVSVMTKIIPIVTGILEILSALLGLASERDINEIEDPTSVILGYANVLGVKVPVQGPREPPL